jgi:hypothetical protein
VAVLAVSEAFFNVGKSPRSSFFNTYGNFSQASLQHEAIPATFCRALLYSRYQEILNHAQLKAVAIFTGSLEISMSSIDAL